MMGHGQRFIFVKEVAGRINDYLHTVYSFTFDLIIYPQTNTGYII